jgi:outer membrane receptor for ferric coprogen and ferric-rhodotorulic acid
MNTRAKLAATHLRPALAGVLFALPVLGQQAPITATDTRPTTTEITELSPFVVTSDSDVGYLASNTLAGSRFNTALKDTPASISVLTPEFLADIGAFDLEEAMGYAVNVELQLEDDRQAISDNETTEFHQRYRVRGINASMARNYFSWEIPTETAFIERIEESRGPNAVLFGFASAGVLINANTKQARTGRSFLKGCFTVFDRDSYRASIDVNLSMLGG